MSPWSRILVRMKKNVRFAFLICPSSQTGLQTERPNWAVCQTKAIDRCSVLIDMMEMEEMEMEAEEGTEKQTALEVVSGWRERRGLTKREGAKYLGPSTSRRHYWPKLVERPLNCLAVICYSTFRQGCFDTTQDKGETDPLSVSQYIIMYYR
ncbi:hypothetical protein GGR58DRAFT_33131 [Xylaria digitata]|nr:hypothetical protein GGR58DRAFT_33131 [Xylaria digitata]